jgi:hypothetical protein
MNKYQLGEKLYYFNVGGIRPLVTVFEVNGMVFNEGAVLYTKDKNNWVKEDYLFRTRMESYTALISQAQAEMINPELTA